VITRTAVAFKGAASEVRAAWTAWHSAAAVALAFAAFLPAYAPPWVHVDGVAGSLYLALAATGLWLSAGLGGMPSLGQGAFMAAGAFTVALLVSRTGVGPLSATLLAVLVAAAGGALAGAGVMRLQPVFVAVTTWILSWGAVLFLLAFPRLSGGAQGIVVKLTLTPVEHYELALALVVLAVLASSALARGRPGVELRALAQRPAAALALGVDSSRRRIGAFVASAAVAGLAGGLTVQLVGVADPGDYGPFLSFQLLAAVLLGGTASALGPAVGVAVLALVNGAALVIGRVEGVSAERFNPMLAALVLLAVLAVGGESDEVGIVPAVRRRLGRARPSAPARGSAPAPRRGGELAVRSLSKRFAGVVAAEDVSFVLRPGEVCALIGPNGSGKTTVLRLIAGTLRPDAGSIALDGADLAPLVQRERAAAGVVRTLQSGGVFNDLSALENALVGAALHRRYGGALRTVVATPHARREEEEVRGAALSLLEAVGIRLDSRARELAGPEQRVLALASALGTRPRVLLLDEPSAGSSQTDLARLEALIRRSRDAGLAILLVEHNLRLVRSIADRVLVMAAGRVIAEGRPEDVAADAYVREAYLGRRSL
jgi:branched-chain amino acid transport system permease protein